MRATAHIFPERQFSPNVRSRSRSLAYTPRQVIVERRVRQCLTSRQLALAEYVLADEVLRCGNGGVSLYSSSLPQSSHLEPIHPAAVIHHSSCKPWQPPYGAMWILLHPYGARGELSLLCVAGLAQRVVHLHVKSAEASRESTMLGGVALAKRGCRKLACRCGLQTGRPHAAAQDPRPHPGRNAHARSGGPGPCPWQRPTPRTRFRWTPSAALWSRAPRTRH